ncbi:MAG: hypothetical protein R3314_14705 [Longimicrobiales bacterium]|nr:hypothetical protein [Longimicrobiales bacterium]
MIHRVRALLAAAALPAALAGCVTFGSEQTGGREPQTVYVEVSHDLATAGSVIIWINPRLDRGEQLGSVAPNTTVAFEYRMRRPGHGWVLRALSPSPGDRRSIVVSRVFYVEPEDERVFWNLNTNIVRIE